MKHLYYLSNAIFIKWNNAKPKTIVKPNPIMPLSLYCIFICHKEFSSGGVIPFPVIAEYSKYIPAIKKVANAINAKKTSTNTFLYFSVFHNPSAVIQSGTFL